jgi:hypothetical protein
MTIIIRQIEPVFWPIRFHRVKARHKEIRGLPSSRSLG